MSVDGGGKVSWGESPLILNPWDDYAVEEALLLRDEHGGTVTAISMGPEAALESLKQAVAMGCDWAIRVWDGSCEGSDTLSTSRALAKAIEKIGDVDLVLFGRSTIDADTWQTGPAVAQRLGFTSLMYVIKIAKLDAAAGTIVVERLLEEGREVVSARLPAVVGTTKGINEPRYTSFMGIRQASRIVYPCWSTAEIGVAPQEAGSAGAAVRWPQVFAPPPRGGQAEIVEGTSATETARLLVGKLRAEKVI